MNSVLSETELAELICTRISHDVIGNVGAVANAVELLEEGDMEFLDDIRSILNVSSSVLSARLKFFRLAFGLSNVNLDKTDLVAQTAADYLGTIGNKNYPITLELELHGSRFSRMALVGIMIIADTMIKGGKIEAREIDDKLIIVSHSQTAPSPEKIFNIKTALAGRIPDNVAQYAPVFYLNSLSTQQNQTLKIIEDPALGLIIG